MKKEQRQVIIALSDAELEKRLVVLDQELAVHKMELSVGKLKNVRVLKTLRYERALVKTIQAQRRLEVNPQVAL